MRTAKFEIYRDQASQYRWRLKASNGEIIAIGEAYVSKHNAIRSADRIKQLASRATIVDMTLRTLAR